MISLLLVIFHEFYVNALNEIFGPDKVQCSPNNQLSLLGLFYAMA